MNNEQTRRPAPAAIRFQAIWDNYPSSDPCVDIKTGKPPPGFDNQCAVRVGYALEKAGVSFNSFRGTRCPVSSRTSGLAASAEVLADWLKTRPFPGCPTAESYEGSVVFDKIKDRTGVIFLANYWQRPGEKGSSRSATGILLMTGMTAGIQAGGGAGALLAD